jgi:pilus assembly protein CpaB
MNSRQRRGMILLLTAGMLGLVTFVLVAGYVSTVRSEVGDRATVYRLTRDVPAFTALQASDTEPVHVPRRWIGPADYTDRSFIGRQTSVPMKASTFVSESDLVPADDLREGEREIAINVDAEAGVAGRIDPGDYVNVNVTFEQQHPELKLAQVLIRRARIVGVGVRHSSPNDRGESRDVLPVTFALSEPDSLKLLYAESFAKTIRLSKVLAYDTGAPPGYRPFTDKDVRAMARGAK